MARVSSSVLLAVVALLFAALLRQARGHRLAVAPAEKLVGGGDEVAQSALVLREKPKKDRCSKYMEGSEAREKEGRSFIRGGFRQELNVTPAETSNCITALTDCHTLQPTAQSLPNPTGSQHINSSSSNCGSTSHLAEHWRWARRVRASQTRIDYLVLNAGIMALPELEKTADGFEKQIGVNHFGHALLTRLLRPTLEAQRFPSRIVTLSSTAHNMAQKLDLEDLHFKKEEYSAWGAYGNSKLANALFAKALAKRLPADGRISSLSVHPGVIRTNLWRSTPAGNVIGGWLLDLILSNKDIPQGAATTVWACLAERLTRPSFAGAYLSDCEAGTLSEQGQDNALAEALWETTDAQLDAALAKRGLTPDGEPVE